MDIYVVDTETSLHNEEVGKFKAHPMAKANWVVWLGADQLHKNTLQPIHSLPLQQKFMTKAEFDRDVWFDPADTLLIGHNIGFDLLHLANSSNKQCRDWRNVINHPGFLIWDTQLAAYRLSGQTMISPSLDACCEARGWKLKPSKMKEYWQAGVSTEDIPADEIQPYLDHDVRSTGKLFREQIREAQSRGMLDMLRIEMQSRLTTLVMELNGMCFDKDQAIIDRDAILKPLREEAEETAITEGMALFDVPRVAVKPGSPMFLKAVLYGGTVKWREQRPLTDDKGDVVYFKTGKKKGEIKLKWHDCTKESPAFSPVDLTVSDIEALNKIRAHRRCTPQLDSFLNEVCKFRDGQKQEKTYFTGYSDLTWDDGMIHGNLNHCIAATGRLSSSNPNLQNAGHSPIRTHFASRYKDGSLMEVDLSQIEVVVQAFLSQDTNMIQDIKDGIDFHTKRAAFAHKEDYDKLMAILDDDNHPDQEKWIKIRKGAKVVSFQKAYGAGVKKISETTGLTRKEVMTFMEAEDTNYPNVPLTQEAWIKEVERTTTVRDGKVCGILINPIGVEYRFFQENFNGHATYKPTCIKNYGIQGFSADILKIILAGLRKVINLYNVTHQPTGRSPLLLINTVHDSVILDVPKWVDVQDLGRLLRYYFTTEPIAVLKNTWGVDFNVPIKADVDVGVNWKKMKAIKL